MTWFPYIVLSVELSSQKSDVQGFSISVLEEKISRFHQLFDERVRSHKGSLELFTGDQGLALFGKQDSAEAEEDAINSALELKSAIQDIFNHLRDPALSPVLFKCGIAAGEVFRSKVENNGFTMLGSVIERVQRICQFADFGQILADEAVRDALNKRYSFERLEPIPVRGEDKKLIVYELILPETTLNL